MTMRPLFLDYQRKAPGRSKLGWAILAAGVFSAGMAIHSFIDVRQDLKQAEYNQARLERKPVPVVRGELNRSVSVRLAEELKFANATVERLTLPWEELLQAIEVATTADVALLSVEPDVQRKLLRITAETKNKGDMLSYVGRLSDSRRLSGVHLVNHQIGSQEPGQPVRFSMQASWGANSIEQN
jgi:hypothetical protein